MADLAPLTVMLPVRGRRPVPANCRVDELQVDPAYQRNLTRESKTLIRNIAHAWDWALCQPLIVGSRPDGSLWIVDGQHRHAAAGLRGDILDLPCVIVPFADQAAEAQAFVALNTARKGLSPFSVWRAAVAAGDAQAVALAGLLDRHGLRMTGNTSSVSLKAGEMANVTQLRLLLSRHGEAVIDRALGVYVAAFGDDAPRYQATLFGGIALLLASPSGEEAGIDARLVAALRGRGQLEWYQLVHDRSVAMGMGDRVAAVQVMRLAATGGLDQAAMPPTAARQQRGGVSPAKPVSTAPSTPPPATPPSPAPTKAPRPAGKRISFEEQMQAVANGASLVAKIAIPSREVATGGSSLGGL